METEQWKPNLWHANMLWRAAKDVNGIAIADVNGDGKLDVATASDGTWSSASVFLGNGDGTFQTPVSYYAPDATSIANFNGKPDLLVADEYDSSAWVLLGNGKGIFQPAVAYATDWQPQGLVVADFNKDANLDFVAARSKPNSPRGGNRRTD